MIVIIDGTRHEIEHPRLEAIIECMLSAKSSGLLFRDLLSVKDDDDSLRPVRFTTHCGREPGDVDIQTDMRFRPEK